MRYLRQKDQEGLPTAVDYDEFSGGDEISG
jgi:hypothetical protein